MTKPVGVTFRAPEKAEPYLAALRGLGIGYREGGFFIMIARRREDAP